MEGSPEDREPKFLGKKFRPGDQVRFLDPEHGGYANDARFKGKNVFGIFTVDSVETRHRPATGEPDDIGEYDYQIVILKGLSFEIASDQLTLVALAGDAGESLFAKKK